MSNVMFIYITYTHNKKHRRMSSDFCGVRHTLSELHELNRINAQARQNPPPDNIEIPLFFKYVIALPSSVTITNLNQRLGQQTGELNRLFNNDLSRFLPTRPKFKKYRDNYTIPKIRFIQLESVQTMETEKTYTSLTDVLDDYGVPQPNILHIFVIKVPDGIGLQGKAYVPGNVLFVRYEALGNFTKPPLNNGVAAAHEAGHALGLPHIFMSAKGSTSCNSSTFRALSKTYSVFPVQRTPHRTSQANLLAAGEFADNTDMDRTIYLNEISDASELKRFESNFYTGGGIQAPRSCIGEGEYNAVREVFRTGDYDGEAYFNVMDYSLGNNTMVAWDTNAVAIMRAHAWNMSRGFIEQALQNEPGTPTIDQVLTAHVANPKVLVSVASRTLPENEDPLPATGGPFPIWLIAVIAGGAILALVITITIVRTVRSGGLGKR